MSSVFLFNATKNAKNTSHTDAMINKNGVGGVFMELPKNVTQIGESDKSCKIYVEDYVVSYLKQLNRVAGDKNLAAALYGIHKEEAGISYLFIYGAAKLNFLQRDSRHLSQAVQQEAEKQRQRFFREYSFLGYKVLNGEMIEGFQICEQGVCRYISGYAQFYEKNDGMLAYMLEERPEEAVPEQVEQEKYDMVKKRQEERRLQAELEKRHDAGRDRSIKETQPEQRLRRMKYSAAAAFAVLCVAGLASMSNGGGWNGLRTTVRQMMENLSEQQLPDAMEVSNLSAEAGTIVAEDKLAEAIRQENESAFTYSEDMMPTSTPTPTPTPTATPEPTPEPEPEPEATSDPVSYVIKKGDTLIGICTLVYGNDARVQEVCDFNGIKNPDNIKIGQIIWLP